MDETQAIAIGEERFGLTGRARRLPGYDDDNFKIETDEGSVFVMKVAAEGVRLEELELQNAALRHLKQACPDIRVPEILPDRDGQYIIRLESGRLVRLLSFLPGHFYVDASEPTEKLEKGFGRFLASLGQGFSSFDHPEAHREFEWDLAHASPVIREHLSYIRRPERRTHVEQLLTAYEAQVMPRLGDLRCQVIHGDANEFNVLIDNPESPGRITGIIDFSDMIHTALIHEVAIAGAYASMFRPDPVITLGHLAAGYHERVPLTAEELGSLFLMAAMRLATSVCMSSKAILDRPENTYITASAEPAFKTLERMAAIHPEAAAGRIGSVLREKRPS
ncbi:MAG: phosphotransferase [Verrucomicrobiota bacterium]